MTEPQIDVFISHHTKTCLPITEAVCNQLESKGIRVWYAPRDTVDSYARSIVSAINRCQVFVLILNKESSFSEDVLNEINLAVERLRQGEKISILPFHITDEEISNDAKYYIGRMHWIDAITPPMHQRIEELVLKVSYLLERKEEQAQEKCLTSTLKSTPLFPNPNFVGRQKEISEIYTNLKEYGRTFLMGMGGIGKTEIAKQYIRLYQKEYSNVIFLKYETSLRDMILNEKELSIPSFSRREENGIIESDEQYFFRKLEKLQQITDEKTLLVIDNFDTDTDSDLKLFLEGPYQVLFTTRNEWDYLGYPIIKVTAFTSLEEQLQLFSFHYKIKIQENEKKYIIQILKWIGGHTLTIELIAKLMYSKRIRAEKMLSILKEEGITTHLDGKVNHGFQKANTVYGYIELLFNTSKLSQEEIMVLCNLWMFPATGFDLETFAMLCSLEDCSCIDGLIKKSWIIYDFYEDKIALHPIIAELIQEKYHPDFEMCSVMIHNMTKWFYATQEKNKEEKNRDGEVAQTLYTKFPHVTIPWANVYIAMIDIFLANAHYEEAESILNEMLTLYQMPENKDEKMESLIYYYLGDLCLYRRENEKACTYLEKALACIRKHHSNSFDEGYANDGYLTKFLAFAYLKVGRYEEAQKKLQESRKIVKHFVEEKSLTMASQYVAEARVHYYLKEYNEAIQLAQKSYDILFELNSAGILSPMQTLAMSYAKKKDYEKAIAMGEEMIKKAEQIYERYQLPVLNRYEIVADIYIEAGNIEQAKHYFMVILEELENHHDIDTPYYQMIQTKMKNLYRKKHS